MVNYVQNTRKNQKWFKEGRGQGRNEDYKPWLHMREVPSHGLSVRMPSLKAGRVLQLFSLNEFFQALLAETFGLVVHSPTRTLGQSREKVSQITINCHISRAVCRRHDGLPNSSTHSNTIEI